MDDHKQFFNSSQPQTLQISVILLYINAVFSLLGGGVTSPIWLAFAAGEAAGGFGIANERKWGYILAITVAILPLALVAYLFVRHGPGGVSVNIISLMFQVALVALLLHRQSREYERIWFK